MISADEPVFPNNAVNLIAARTRMLDEDLFVCKRPLRTTDPNQSVGIMPVQWSPDEDSYEMGGHNSRPATLSLYQLSIQAFVKDMDEERGLAAHSVLSAMIRRMVYGDPALRVGLSSLATNVGGIGESMKRWGVRRQGYLSNEIDKSFIHLSTLEVWLETETY